MDPYTQQIRERGLKLLEEGTANGKIIRVLGRSGRAQGRIRRAKNEQDRPPGARDVPAKWFRKRPAHYAHLAAAGLTFVIRGRGMMFVLYPPETRDELLVALDAAQEPGADKIASLVDRLDVIADDLGASALRLATSNASRATADMAPLEQRLAALEEDVRELKRQVSARAPKPAQTRTRAMRVSKTTKRLGKPDADGRARTN